MVELTDCVAKAEPELTTVVRVVEVLVSVGKKDVDVMVKTVAV